MRQATASIPVDVLERRGLLERRRDTKDSRGRTSTSPPTASARPTGFRKPAEGLLPDALSRLEPAALERLDGLIGRMRTGEDSCGLPQAAG